MVASWIARPAARFIRCTRTPLSFPLRPAATLPISLNRRTYATPSGVKELAVRDALNEALAEELESNSKVFVLGEEVAQYNGALVPPLEESFLCSRAWLSSQQLVTRCIGRTLRKLCHWKSLGSYYLSVQRLKLFPAATRSRKAYWIDSATKGS